MQEQAAEQIGNIIIFPKDKCYGPPSSVEELKEIIVANKTATIEYFAEELTKEIFKIMGEHGYEVTHIQDITYVLISLKAILLRHESIHHPIQDFIDETIDLANIKPIT
jgi:hypothetical protein